MTNKAKIIRADSAFFEDSRGQRLQSIFGEIMATGVLPTRGVEEGYKLGEEFQSLFANTVYSYRQIDIGKEHDFSKVYSVHLFPEAGTRQQDFRFEVMLAYFASGMAQIINRRLPIVWHIDHIEKRFAQRTQSNLDYAKGLSETVHLALAMGRVFDKMAKGENFKQAPFVLPFGEGLLLGICSPEKKEMTHNRVGYWAMATAAPTEPYKWQPEITMNINTYISPREMMPGQRRLHEIMTDRFMGAEEYAVLQTGMDFYRTTRSADLNDFRRYTRPDIIEAHDRVLSDIENLMMSKLWRGTVSLPGMQHMEQGIIRPKF